jgi:hypothetical protein
MLEVAQIDGFSSRDKKKKPFLSKKHMVQRLNWAKAHVVDITTLHRIVIEVA